MTKINFELKVTEAVNGYRVDIADWEESHFPKFNTETGHEALAIAIRALQEIQSKLEVL